MSRKRDFYASLAGLPASVLEDVEGLAEEEETAALWRKLEAPPRLLVALDRLTYVEVVEVVLAGVVIQEPARACPYRQFWEVVATGGRRAVEGNIRAGQELARVIE